jgi:hypothetical protein
MIVLTRQQSKGCVLRICVGKGVWRRETYEGGLDTRYGGIWFYKPNNSMATGEIARASAGYADLWLKLLNHRSQCSEIKDGCQ